MQVTCTALITVRRHRCRGLIAAAAAARPPTEVGRRAGGSQRQITRSWEQPHTTDTVPTARPRPAALQTRDPLCSPFAGGTENKRRCLSSHQWAQTALRHRRAEAAGRGQARGRPAPPDSAALLSGQAAPRPGLALPRRPPRLPAPAPGAGQPRWPRSLPSRPGAAADPGSPARKWTPAPGARSPAGAGSSPVAPRPPPPTAAARRSAGPCQLPGGRRVAAMAEGPAALPPWKWGRPCGGRVPAPPPPRREEEPGPPGPAWVQVERGVTVAAGRAGAGVAAAAGLCAGVRWAGGCLNVAVAPRCAGTWSRRRSLAC